MELIRPQGEIEFSEDTDFGDLVELAPEIQEFLEERYEREQIPTASGASIADVARALGKSPEELLRELYEVLSAP